MKTRKNKNKLRCYSFYYISYDFTSLNSNLSEHNKIKHFFLPIWGRNISSKSMNKGESEENIYTTPHFTKKDNKMQLNLQSTTHLWPTPNLC